MIISVVWHVIRVVLKPSATIPGGVQTISNPRSDVPTFSNPRTQTTPSDQPDPRAADMLRSMSDAQRATIANLKAQMEAKKRGHSTISSTNTPSRTKKSVAFADDSTNDVDASTPLQLTRVHPRNPKIKQRCSLNRNRCKRKPRRKP